MTEIVYTIAAATSTFLISKGMDAGLAQYLIIIINGVLLGLVYVANKALQNYPKVMEALHLGVAVVEESASDSRGTEKKNMAIEYISEMLPKLGVPVMLRPFVKLALPKLIDGLCVQIKTLYYKGTGVKYTPSAGGKRGTVEYEVTPL